MLPPDMMGALGASDLSADPSATFGQESAPEESSRSTSEILQEMISSANEYLGVEQDEEDKLTMTKVLTQLQQYLAKEQSENDDLLQGKASPRALRKASSGPQG